MMPGNFYARAFIKQYAEAVGLDPDVLFDEYASELPKADDDVPERMSRVNREKQQVSNKGSKLFSMLPTVLVIVLLLAVAVSIWVFSLNNNDDSQSPVDQTESSGAQNDEEISIETPDKDSGAADNDQPQQDDAEQDDKEADKEDDQPADMSFEQVNQSSSGTPTTTFELSGTDKFELELVSNKQEGRSYVDVKDSNGSYLYSQELNKGKSESLDLTSESQVVINVGFAPDVDIKINGEKIEYPFPASETVHQKVVVQYKKGSES